MTTAQPTGESQPTGEIQPAGEIQPTGETQPAGEIQPAGESQAPGSARPATGRDLDAVVELRALLLAEMGLAVQEPRWRAAARAALSDGLERGRLTVQVAERDGDVVACAVALLQDRLPTPGTPTGTYGWLEQVATLPAARGRGAARSCVLACLDWLRAQGVREVQMQATPAGEPLYRELGFVDEPQARLLRRLDR